MENKLRRSLILPHFYNSFIPVRLTGRVHSGRRQVHPWVRRRVITGTIWAITGLLPCSRVFRQYSEGVLKVFCTNVSSYRPALNQTLTSHSRKFQGSLSFKMFLFFKNRRENLSGQFDSSCFLNDWKISFKMMCLHFSVWDDFSIKWARFWQSETTMKCCSLSFMLMASVLVWAQTLWVFSFLEWLTSYNQYYKVKYGGKIQIVTIFRPFLQDVKADQALLS